MLYKVSLMTFVRVNRNKDRYTNQKEPKALELVRKITEIGVLFY